MSDSTLIIAHPAREESADEVRVRRGSPQEALQRIRARYNLTEDIMEVREIFRLACRLYHGSEHMQQKADIDHANFEVDNVLPYYMWRCADPDVYYPEMRA